MRQETLRKEVKLHSDYARLEEAVNRADYRLTEIEHRRDEVHRLNIQVDKKIQTYKQKE